jgi:glutamine amidotransferase
VGAARSAMESLQEKGLDNVIKALKQPVLGICVGMQLLFAQSEENNTTCLGIIPAAVKLFRPTSLSSKVPQIGWNTVYNLKSPLFASIADQEFVYYVHSYYAEMNQWCVATSQYGIEYAAAVQKDNFYGVQFHTEKSAKTGAQILKNFLDRP